jgi:hypothetical protein
MVSVSVLIARSLPWRAFGLLALSANVLKERSCEPIPVWLGA